MFALVWLAFLICAGGVTAKAAPPPAPPPVGMEVATLNAQVAALLSRVTALEAAACFASLPPIEAPPNGVFNYSNTNTLSLNGKASTLIVPVGQKVNVVYKWLFSQDMDTDRGAITFLAVGVALGGTHFGQNCAPAPFSLQNTSISFSFTPNQPGCYGVTADILFQFTCVQSALGGGGQEYVGGFYVPPYGSPVPLLSPPLGPA